MFKSLFETLVKEVENKHQRTIAVDFDGTISEYSGWKGADNFGAPIQATIDKLRKEKEAGTYIIIHTCRVNPELNNGDGFDSGDALDLLGKWLIDHDVPHDEIWVNEGKPIADEYWDDRAVKITQ